MRHISTSEQLYVFQKRNQSPAQGNPRLLLNIYEIFDRIFNDYMEESIEHGNSYVKPKLKKNEWKLKSAWLTRLNIHVHHYKILKTFFYCWENMVKSFWIFYAKDFFWYVTKYINITIYNRHGRSAIVAMWRAPTILYKVDHVNVTCHVMEIQGKFAEVPGNWVYIV